MPSIADLTKGQSDPTLREAGVWATFVIPGVTEPLKLKLRSVASNVARMWDIKKYREQRNYYIDDNVPPIEVLDQNECDKLAEALVTDWNITEEDGSPAPLGVESCRAVMAQVPDIRRDALAEAAKHNRYRAAEVQAIAKNSERPSSTDSDTVAAGA